MERLIDDVRDMFGERNAELVRSVTTVVKAKVRARNLFGWQTFIDDVLIQLITHMIQTDFMYSGGAYVNCGIQGAIDRCRYCNAAKRKGEYEKVSLDDERFFAIPDPKPNRERDLDQLCISIEMRFGKDLAEELRPYLIGYEKKLSNNALKKIRTAEFMSWFEEYRT